ncbi:MFS transporter [Microbacterium saccharophilum]|uniref:MFS transporter, CP family, cyanate transporter n=1 Tax=Microbacterium saccharophilum TaxID=1213358 RepID=A0A7Z7D175_9MICO|nr:MULTISPECIES: MFS transporter [Microbacterium]SFI74721.1 MFS transporter, CP family, cyanate transporter [Microbacterium saccharophilum]
MTTRPVWQGRTLALLGIALFAFSLRSAVASLSPVVDQIQADISVPAWAIGLIGTAPPVCFALFGILTPQIERRWGLERTSVLALAVVTIGLVARGLAGDATALVLSTALIFAGVGMGNILLPPLVNKHFPDRIGLMTTVYTTTMSFSTFLPPLFAVPVADAAGWRFSLALWSVFALLAIIPWMTMLLRDRGGSAAADLASAAPGVFRRLWRLPLAWALTVIFLVSSCVAYTSFAWLPTMLIDLAGVTPAEAGGMLSLFGVMGLPASLLVPVLVTRYRALPALFTIAVLAGLGGLAGLLFAPTAAPWAWAALLGVAPLLFPLSLVMISLRTRTHEGTVALSGFVQSVGYAIAATVPLAVGILHDATGDWTGSLILLAVVVAAVIPAAISAVRPRTIEDEWERRHGAWQ